MSNTYFVACWTFTSLPATPLLTPFRGHGSDFPGGRGVATYLAIPRRSTQSFHARAVRDGRVKPWGVRLPRVRFGILSSSGATSQESPASLAYLDDIVEEKGHEGSNEGSLPSATNSLRYSAIKILTR